MPEKKTILVAPLHWGLGHATRCIPIINALLKHQYNVLLASDGAALLLLQKEFPELEAIELPAYNITYSKKGRNFKWKLMLKFPEIKRTTSEEKKIIKELVEKKKIQGIINDNRFGVRHPSLPCVFITHQLNVLTGSTSFLSSRMHQKIIKKFDVCWVPDVADAKLNLSGNLGHLKNAGFPIKYLGILSRMKKMELQKKYEILVLLSGPEPQRSLLEEKLIKVLKSSTNTVLLIRGIVKDEQEWSQQKNIHIVNFMKTDALEKAINESEIVISRSGYTTIMDLAILEKKAFFIPTPGQYEQEYLAKRLKKLGVVPSCKQENFTLKKLDKIAAYKGLKSLSQPETNYTDLFSLFQGK